MKITTIAIVAATLLTALPAAANNTAGPLLQGSELKFSRLMSNDHIGDRKDRWRTFAYGLSVLKGTDSGAVHELRFRTEIIAGRRLKVEPGGDLDRRMAGVMGVGAYRSDRVGAADYRVGLDVTAIGPQTGMVDFQKWFHELIQQHGPSDYARDMQIPDAISLGASGELGRDFQISSAAVRPWVAAAAGGPEPSLRAGLDMIWGHAAGEFGVRDEVTGWRLPMRRDRDDVGRSVLAGVDVAKISSSKFFPDGDHEETRLRARVGGLTDFAGGRLFYGATYLSEEFKAQPEGQVLGSIGFTMLF